MSSPADRDEGEVIYASTAIIDSGIPAHLTVLICPWMPRRLFFQPDASSPCLVVGIWNATVLNTTAGLLSFTL